MKQDPRPVDRQQYWEHVYAGRKEQDLSWFQPHPELSLALIQSAGLSEDDAIIDIGGGTSSLVDLLLQGGVKHLSVLDIAHNALQQAKQRLGEQASAVNWIHADITEGVGHYKCRLWHDRAVFHFMVDQVDRRRYLSAMQESLLPGGFAIIASFSPEGPEQCSGLPVQRYSPESLAQTLGPAFRLLESRIEGHRTPAGRQQEFIYCMFQKEPS